jgi:6-phosphogluconolactonase (cycloisomerase 2 family)
MFRSTPRWRGRSIVGAVAALALLGVPAAAALADPGALYTQTNDPAGNVVQAFDRDARGGLTPAGTFPTGGLGLATLGGRQGAVELSDDESTVYAVNAGSGSVSALRVRRHGLELASVTSSGGSAPDSVDEHHDRVYVLNSGGTPNVTAFRAGRDGSLEQIGSQDLPGALGAAQVTVSPGGDALVVSERLSNRLETLPLDSEGRPGAPVVTASSGAVPFGFAFGHRDDMVVSEAGASTVSSYRLDSGALSVVTGSLPVGFGAACWVAVSPNGRFTYTGNASGSISGFTIGRDGALRPLGTTPTPSPRDLDFSRDGRYLYAVSPTGRATGYRVGSDGSLEQVTSVPAGTGITGAAAG